MATSRKIRGNVGGYNQAGKKETITFALDARFVRILREDAEREGMSVNSKMNNMLLKYALCYRYTEASRCAIFPYMWAQSVIDGTGEQNLMDQYRSIVHDLIPSGLLQAKVPLTLPNWLTHFCNGMMLYGGAIEGFSSYRDDEGYLCLVYRHSYGIKWSRILSVVLSEFIENMLKFHTTSTILPSSVVIKILEKNAEGI